MRRENAKVTCPLDGDVIVETRSMHIDDENEVYRFTCKGKCASVVEKPFDDKIRQLLRDYGIPTVEEMCNVFAGQLNDDRAIARVLFASGDEA